MLSERGGSSCRSQEFSDNFKHIDCNNTAETNEHTRYKILFYNKEFKDKNSLNWIKILDLSGEVEEFSDQKSLDLDDNDAVDNSYDLSKENTSQKDGIKEMFSFDSNPIQRSFKKKEGEKEKNEQMLLDNDTNTCTSNTSSTGESVNKENESELRVNTNMEQETTKIWGKISGNLKGYFSNTPQKSLGSKEVVNLTVGPYVLRGKEFGLKEGVNFVILRKVPDHCSCVCSDSVDDGHSNHSAYYEMCGVVNKKIDFKDRPIFYQDQDETMCDEYYLYVSNCVNNNWLILKVGDDILSDMLQEHAYFKVVNVDNNNNNNYNNSSNNSNNNSSNYNYYNGDHNRNNMNHWNDNKYEEKKYRDDNKNRKVVLCISNNTYYIERVELGGTILLLFSMSWLDDEKTSSNNYMEDTDTNTSNNLSSNSNNNITNNSNNSNTNDNGNNNDDTNTTDKNNTSNDNTNNNNNKDNSKEKENNLLVIVGSTKYGYNLIKSNPIFENLPKLPNIHLSSLFEQTPISDMEIWDFILGKYDQYPSYYLYQLNDSLKYMGQYFFGEFAIRIIQVIPIYFSNNPDKKKHISHLTVGDVWNMIESYPDLFEFVPREVYNVATLFQMLLKISDVDERFLSVEEYLSLMKSDLVYEFNFKLNLFKIQKLIGWCLVSANYYKDIDYYQYVYYLDDILFNKAVPSYVFEEMIEYMASLESKDQQVVDYRKVIEFYYKNLNFTQVSKLFVNPNVPSPIQNQNKRLTIFDKTGTDLFVMEDLMFNYSELQQLPCLNYEIYKINTKGLTHLRFSYSMNSLLSICRCPLSIHVSYLSEKVVSLLDSSRCILKIYPVVKHEGLRDTLSELFKLKNTWHLEVLENKLKSFFYGKEAIDILTGGPDYHGRLWITNEKNNENYRNKNVIEEIKYENVEKWKKGREDLKTIKEESYIIINWNVPV